MLRFAPSPTGDMHIGNLRVALFNYIMSKQRSEPLLLRIEDTDQERNIPGKEDEILAILALFGIEHQEHQFQSNNLRFHRAMALQLLHDKKAFSCFCTPETLEASREAAKENKTAYRYDGQCENLRAEEVIDNTNPFTVRLKKPSESITVKDIIKGESTFAPNDIDSFIIMRADKLPTYDFACAVDDMLSDISLIIRGEDHLSNTPKQIAIQRALGYDRVIEYAHLPIILSIEGKKMSKRDDASSVKWLLEEGFLPDAISNYLIWIGNKTPCEIFTLKEAIKWFDLQSISKAPAQFDIDKLKFMNREHLKGLDPKELSRYVGFADEEIGRLAKIFLDEVSTLKELRVKINAIFAPKIVPDEFKEGFDVLKKLTLVAPHFDDYDSYESYLIEHSGLKGKNLFKPLRYLLSGSEHGPELNDIYTYLKNYLKEVAK
ncbi:MAG: glutamate--tRNA ligase [Sulfuricurvum sp.]|uniref:glutamate--tRNA ligase n=1 Tax=Sulfuricurvum sp. TaxID=2025608 RepID=UPI002610A955|nr:glutamate--tRNA ligase [Sulfuricurvum sp.]MDD2829015.1 glutamate--tRNA ligase [Sulfuricurvum sp.]MDD4949662.1 glutamate--tRNA ligase [Sulfuricurvum sp.]